MKPIKPKGKPVEIDNYDPDTIMGKSVDDSWFEALNMVTPVVMDPDVKYIYILALTNWPSHPYLGSSKEVLLKDAVDRLMKKYNP